MGFKETTAACLAAGLLSACASAPKPLTSALSTTERADVMRDLVLGQETKIYIFCEAEADRIDQCAEGSKGLSAAGLGGLFLPLAMNITALEIERNKGQTEAKMRSIINAIPVACATAKIDYDADRATLSSNGFYCNWAGIGNVITSFDFAVSDVNAQTGTFAGTYRIGFLGTGNGGGRGVFLARPADVETESDELTSSGP